MLIVDNKILKSIMTFKNAQNIPYLIHIRVLIKLINITMYLKVFYFSFINLLVALAVNPANASPKKNLMYETIKYHAYLEIW